MSDANAARCPTPDPDLQCNVLSLDPQSSATDFRSGLGYFSVTSSAGEAQTMVLGQSQAGPWYLYLWGQEFYNPVHLPELVTICAFGKGSAVHSSANTTATVVATLTDGASATAEQFILTQPGTLPRAAPALPGYGWYRLTSPDGWIYSKYVAEGSTCDLHDRLQKQ